MIFSNNYGIRVSYYAQQDVFFRNVIRENGTGITTGGYASGGHVFYHNDIVDNTVQCTYTAPPSIWDNGYPDGGNYWSDYVGIDDFKGASQDIPGSDGIGDTPYVIDSQNKDRYPLTKQFHAISIGIDIKPGSYPNSLNTDGHGVIPVAILGSADFDVSQIDISSLSFAGLMVRVKGQDQPQCSTEDVSGDFSGGPQGAPDGYPDLVCQFVDNPDNWSAGEAEATLTGNLTDGTPFSGSDEITIVPPTQ